MQLFCFLLFRNTLLFAYLHLKLCHDYYTLFMTKHQAIFPEFQNLLLKGMDLLRFKLADRKRAKA